MERRGSLGEAGGEGKKGGIEVGGREDGGRRGEERGKKKYKDKEE